MKKVVITVLLVLPLVLIYFISFTGQMLSQYTHIDVERIAVINHGKEYESGDSFPMQVGESIKLGVTVFPRRATNPKVSIANSNPEVLTVDEETLTLTAHTFGESILMITSLDKRSIQFKLVVKVTQETPSEIRLGNVQGDSLSLVLGQEFSVMASVYPSAVRHEYKHLVWEAVNPAGEPVISVNQNGKITAHREGEAKVVVKTRSTAFAPIVCEIAVTVTSEYGKGVWFERGGTQGALIVTEAELDLRSITVLKGLDGVSLQDVTYAVTGNEAILVPESLDGTRIPDGVLRFAAPGIVKVSVSLPRGDGSYNTSDKITVVYQPPAAP